MVTKRNGTIDFFKYIAALMIVAIHSLKVFGADSFVDFFLVNILARVAVPFFVICSGYFLSAKIVRGDDEFKSAIFRQWKKLLALYLVWSAVYLVYSIPGWISSGWFSAHAFVDYGIAMVRSGSHYHLWYLLSMIYALPVFYILVKRLKGRSLYLVAGVLWIIKVFSYAYVQFLPDCVRTALGLLGYFSGLSDAICCFFPLLVLGLAIRRVGLIRSRTCVLGLGLCFALLCVEAFVLRNAGQTSVSYIFMTAPVAYFLFQGLLCVKIPAQGRFAVVATMLGAVSLEVYCVHPIFVELTSWLADICIAHFLVSVALATAFGLAVVRIKLLIAKRR